MLRAIGTVLLIGLACIIVGCEKDSPTGGGKDNSTPLAGGGRYDANDPYGGDPSNPGWDWEFPPIDSGQSYHLVLFYGERNCGAEPGHFIINDSATWDEWYRRMDSCVNGQYWWEDTIPGDTLPWDTSWWDTSRPDSGWPWPDDSGYTEPDPNDTIGDSIIFYPYPYVPQVNFDSNAVAVINIEEGSGFGRSILVTDIVSDENGTAIHYIVSELDSTCGPFIDHEVVTPPTSPTIAILLSRPIEEPVSWIRTDTLLSCLWEPDPNVPVTMYYTDSPCDLGEPTQVIRDSAVYTQWLAIAVDCDSTRWIVITDSTASDTGSTGPCCPTNPGNWYWPWVDFSAQAVIILRAGPQPNWGGGLWLENIVVSDGGTLIEYAVMVPAESCPPFEGPEPLNPTVAIRVPLPLPEPITWRRTDYSIECNWGNDSTGGWGRD